MQLVLVLKENIEKMIRKLSFKLHIVLTSTETWFQVLFL